MIGVKKGGGDGVWEFLSRRKIFMDKQVRNFHTDNTINNLIVSHISPVKFTSNIATAHAI